MTWVRLDDGFADHPKVDGLTDAAFRLHVAALCHAGRYLTDGLVPADRVPRLTPRFKRTYVAELVDAGLWEPADGGWTIHDFLSFNPTADKVRSEREAAKARMRSKRSSPERSPEHTAERSPGRSPSPSRPVVPAEPKHPPSSAPPTADETFETWWAGYPRKVDKGHAVRAFRAALKLTTVEQLTHGLERSKCEWNAEGRPGDKIPHAATWLNGHRWNDEPTTNGKRQTTLERSLAKLTEPPDCSDCDNSRWVESTTEPGRVVRCQCVAQLVP